MRKEVKVFALILPRQNGSTPGGKTKPSGEIELSAEARTDSWVSAPHASPLAKSAAIAVPAQGLCIRWLQFEDRRRGARNAEVGPSRLVAILNSESPVCPTTATLRTTASTAGWFMAWEISLGKQVKGGSPGGTTQFSCGVIDFPDEARVCPTLAAHKAGHPEFWYNCNASDGRVDRAAGPFMAWEDSLGNSSIVDAVEPEDAEVGTGQLMLDAGYKSIRAARLLTIPTDTRWSLSGQLRVWDDCNASDEGVDIEMGTIGVHSLGRVIGEEGQRRCSHSSKFRRKKISKTDIETGRGIVFLPNPNDSWPPASTSNDIISTDTYQAVLTTMPLQGLCIFWLQLVDAMELETPKWGGDSTIDE
ncbi:hypothetical protein BDK51DRAFT_41142 [Blyttiomyces helicus]|uniref:Uncharacterized protein n=1 Tax=Blyttiomyces helicus TaxID=388810 RepID=A0A4P9WKH7_9FUNG|nr:hypothetical protein BDK51DRAFT_41142 [Blyttiomyces helicus]|eukprot:RKO92513.1 hypothetical protein BDK51DRAFT_41142 [Blyttiomyces helicus]